MFEYIIVFLVVGWAVWYTGRQMWKEIRHGQCAACSCPSSRKNGPQLIQLSPPDPKK